MGYKTSVLYLYASQIKAEEVSQIIADAKFAKSGDYLRGRSSASWFLARNSQSSSFPWK